MSKYLNNPRNTNDLCDKELLVRTLRVISHVAIAKVPSYFASVRSLIFIGKHVLITWQYAVLNMVGWIRGTNP